ncbi:MAG: thioredoxin domain-containing protein [bacterium]
MKAAVITSLLFCAALIGLAAYFALQGNGGSSRVVPLHASYTARLQQGGWQEGSTSPKVEIVVYSDLQCPGCQAFDQVLTQAFQNTRESTRLTFRHYITTGAGLDKDRLAARGLEAAGRQGNFWQMKQLLFANQPTWGPETTTEFSATLIEYAKALTINSEQFRLDLQDSGEDDAINHDIAAGDKASVSNIPTIFLNDKLLTPIPGNVADMEAAIRKAEGAGSR